jgi:hypothetical protein
MEREVGKLRTDENDARVCPPDKCNAAHGWISAAN